jgi:hypothetical protein
VTAAEVKHQYDARRGGVVRANTSCTCQRPLEALEVRLRKMFCGVEILLLVVCCTSKVMTVGADFIPFGR